MALSCPDDLLVELHHATSAPNVNMDEDSAVQVAKHQDEMETDESTIYRSNPQKLRSSVGLGMLRKVSRGSDKNFDQICLVLLKIERERGCQISRLNWKRLSMQEQIWQKF